MCDDAVKADELIYRVFFDWDGKFVGAGLAERVPALMEVSGSAVMVEVWRDRVAPLLARYNVYVRAESLPQAVGIASAYTLPDVSS